jgi:Methyltransferase domain
MIDNLKPVTASGLPCKICKGQAELYGVVDFHKSCEQINGLRFKLSGVPIYYYRCLNCKFVFTEAFDNWSTEEFKANIYNEQYKLVDPGYHDESRPRSNGGVVARLWNQHKAETRVLDFGGGNDAFCSVLREHGFPVAVSYDPMVPEFAQRPEGKFDLVTSFETLEHLPDPLAGIASMLESAADPGMIFFTTLLQPADFDQQGLNWWYVGPRNGHVSLFSKEALKLAWAQHGYKLLSLVGDNTHIAFRTLPAFIGILDTSVLDQPKT